MIHQLPRISLNVIFAVSRSKSDDIRDHLYTHYTEMVDCRSEPRFDEVNNIEERIYRNNLHWLEKTMMYLVDSCAVIFLYDFMDDLQT